MVGLGPAVQRTKHGMGKYVATLGIVGPTGLECFWSGPSQIVLRRKHWDQKRNLSREQRHFIATLIRWWKRNDKASADHCKSVSVHNDVGLRRNR